MVDRLPRNEGKNSLIAFVFSCPGSLEEKNKQLVQGQTGNNLTELIKIIREDSPYQRYFDSENRFDYRITNASTIIHYKAKDGVSEPSKGEIMCEENIDRLADDLKGYKVIITFGEKASTAVNSCKDKIGNPQIIHVQHLGFQSLNQIKKDCHGNDLLSSNGDKEVGKSNTLARLKVIKKEIMSKLILIAD